MTNEVFVHRSRVDASADDVFRWHARPGAFERLNPPWQRVHVADGADADLVEGSRVILEVPIGPIHATWVAEHRDVQPGCRFTDVQVSGPFACWTHTHRMTPVGGGESCELEDRIEYALPAGALGRLVASGHVRRMLDRLFGYRHAQTAGDLRAHAAYSGPPLTVAITGSSGLIGSALTAFLSTGGHSPLRLVRPGSPAGLGGIPWNPKRAELDASGLSEVDAVVHLAGESIASGRWSSARKRRILESRVQGTRNLCEALARLPRPPRALVSASAIGFYGDRGDEALDESSTSGEGFLADVCRQWEAATRPAVEAGIRVVSVRTGMVVSAAGGALATMLPPFRACLGGVLGAGDQWVSWISLDDVVGVLHHALVTAELSGPLNAVAPRPVTNRELTKTLGAVLRRPTVAPMPGILARAAFGEMADELLLASTRVVPTALRATGYSFRHEDLESALRHTLGRRA